MSYSVIEGLV